MKTRRAEQQMKTLSLEAQSKIQILELYMNEKTNLVLELQMIEIVQLELQMTQKIVPEHELQKMKLELEVWMKIEKVNPILEVQNPQQIQHLQQSKSKQTYTSTKKIIFELLYFFQMKTEK